MAMTIDCLPNEILVKLFVLYRPPRGSGIDAFERGTKPAWRDACTWAPLMRVCRHWRTVALETPLLWQVVDIGKSTRWLELALVRSRNAVLELYFHAYPTSVEALPMLMPHMHRVRKLLLPAMPLAALRSLFSSVQPATFPVLDELRLWADASEDQRSADYVPFDLSPTRVPALRMLHLQNAVVPWTAMTISTLRFLHLHSCSPAGLRPSFAQFLDGLEECRELEELELHHFISQFAPPSAHDPTRTLRLAKLRALVLGDDPDSIARFIANVYIQESVNVSLEGWPEIIDDDLQQGFRSLLPTDTSNLAVLRTLTEAWITLSNEDEQEIVGVISGRSAPLKMSLQTKIDYSRWFSYHTPLLDEFVSAFEGVSLQVLKLFYDPGAYLLETSLIDVFAAFASLRHIEIIPGGDRLPVFIALSSLSRSRTGPQLPLCPNVKKLEMDYLEWSGQQHLFMLIALRKRADLGLPQLDYLGLGHKGQGARKLRRAMERGRTMAGSFSDYVTEFDCWSSYASSVEGSE